MTATESDSELLTRSSTFVGHSRSIGRSESRMHRSEGEALWRKSTSSQLPIDRGSWLICQEVSLEPAPLYSVCAQHTQTQPSNKSAGGWIRGGSIAIWQALKTTTTMWSDASHPTRILRTRHIQRGTGRLIFQSIMGFPAVEPALSYTAPEPGWLSNHHSRWNMYLQKIAISWGFLGCSLRRLGLRLTYVRGSRPNVTRIRCNSLDM